jgi:hypothetical protein
MRELAFISHFSLIADLGLSGFIHELHQRLPAQFRTSVNTSFAPLWRNNHDVYHYTEADPVQTIDCDKILQTVDQLPPRARWSAFQSSLAQECGIPHPFHSEHGRIFLSDNERMRLMAGRHAPALTKPYCLVESPPEHLDSPERSIHELASLEASFCIEENQLVQVGLEHGYYSKVPAALYLVREVTLRQLISLIYHASKVICSTRLMAHLAHATIYSNPRSANPVIVDLCNSVESIHTYQESSSRASCGERTAHCTKEVVSQDNSVCITTAARPRPIQSPPAALNALTIYTTGMRRSGLHAISDWLSTLFKGPQFFLNDLNHAATVTQDTPCSELPSLPTSKQSRISDSKRLLLVSAEELSLACASRLALPCNLAGHDTRRVNILILRDPYNCIASRIRAFHANLGNGWTQVLVERRSGGIRGVVRLWIELAQEFVALETDPLRNILLINYNRWFGDAQYRTLLASQIESDFPGAEKPNRVPKYGFGSSFDGMSLGRNPERMNLFERWVSAIEDPLFREAMEYSTALHELSERIFGPLSLPNSTPEWFRKCIQI